MSHRVKLCRLIHFYKVSNTVHEAVFIITKPRGIVLTQQNPEKLILRLWKPLGSSKLNCFNKSGLQSRAVEEEDVESKTRLLEHTYVRMATVPG